MRQVQAYTQGDPAALQAAMLLSWEEFWRWLSEQHRMASKG